MTEPLAGPKELDPEALEHEYLRCLLGPDGRAARRLIERAVEDGVPASTLYLKVLAPAMHEVGRLWETAQISVAQEHLCTQITHAVIANLGIHLQSGDPVGRARVVVVGSTPGEMHMLGTQMVADFLETQGWEVLNLGADTPPAELVDLVRFHRAAVVALSTTLPGHLPSVTRTCELLRHLAEPPYIAVGGRAYRGDEARAAAVGADALVGDPERLLELLHRRFAPG